MGIAAKRKKGKKIIIIVVVIIAVLIAAMFIYLTRYYHAEESAKEALQSDAQVSVTEVSEGYLFDGPGEDTAIVFYPGGKVEEESYAPLMHRLAEQGQDVFLLKLPFRLAVFDMDAAEDVISNYDYAHWVLAGHSLGGVAASAYTSEHADEVDGLILLASYPTEEIPEHIRMLSIYGSEDRVLNMKSYEESRNLWAAQTEEVAIDGGNHAQYGNYGAQKGDGEALISADAQQEEVSRIIADAFSE